MLAENKEKVKLKLIDLIFSQLPSGLAVELIVWSFLIYALWPEINHTQLVVWYTLACALCLMRFAIVVRYRINKPSTAAEARTWMKVIAACALCAGLSWAPIGSLFIPTAFNLQANVVFVLIGVTAAANFYYTPLKYMYLLFLIPAYGPHIAWLFSTENMLVGTCALLYAAVMLILSLYSNKIINEALDLQYKNEALVRELTAMNQSLNAEITAHTNTQAKAKLLNDQLMVAARRAGMADIAATVLRNINNALDTMNVSIETLYNKLLDAKASNIDETMHSLRANALNIKNIITVEEAMHKNIGLIENVDLATVLEDALLVNQALCDQYHIEVIREYYTIKNITIDKIKLLQVFVNIIKNCIDSLIQSPNMQKKLYLRVNEMNSHLVTVRICDNGAGIAPEDMNKVFSYDYPTKNQHPGFGLHMSAVALTELGGSIVAGSDGLGKGESFTLLLPYEPKPLRELV